jgi:chromosome segregation ATPase/predicted nucleic acid-binding Zn ribbon protein
MSVQDAPRKAAPPAGDGGRDVAEATCEACGTPLEPDDDFCPACGAELPAGRRLRHRHTLRVAAVVAVLVAALAAAATFATLWQSEASSGDSARGRLRTASAQTAAAQAGQRHLTRELATTRLKLAQVQRLADLRGGVLTQTRVAVKQVEPLLSSVDSLQGITGRIQESRNRFATQAGDVVGRLVDFSNAVLEAQQNGEPLDDAWVEDQIGTLNTKLDRLHASYDALDQNAAAYDTASRRFEARATEFNAVVRRLQQQLLAVVEG